MSSPSRSAEGHLKMVDGMRLAPNCLCGPSNSPSTVHAFLSSGFAAWPTSPFSLDVALLPAPGTPPPLLSP